MVTMDVFYIDSWDNEYLMVYADDLMVRRAVYPCSRCSWPSLKTGLSALQVYRQRRAGAGQQNGEVRKAPGNVGKSIERILGVQHLPCMRSFAQQCGKSGQWWYDYRDRIEFMIPHTGSHLNLRITSTLDGTATDERYWNPWAMGALSRTSFFFSRKTQRGSIIWLCLLPLSSALALTMCS